MPAEEYSAIEAGCTLEEPLFVGPHSIHSTRKKYMNSYREAAGSDEPGGSQAGGAGSARAMKEEGASREATPPPPVSPGLDLAQLVEEQRSFRREMRQHLQSLSAEVAHVAQTTNMLLLHLLAQSSSQQVHAWAPPSSQAPAHGAASLSLSLARSPSASTAGGATAAAPRPDNLQRRLAASLTAPRPLLSSLLAQVEPRGGATVATDAGATTSTGDYYASLIATRLGHAGGHLGLPNLNVAPLAMGRNTKHQK